jgi:carbonic anhydrase
MAIGSAGHRHHRLLLDAGAGNLTLLLARFKSAIDANEYSGDRGSKHAAFVAAVAATHVAQAVQPVRARSPVLAELETKKSIKIVGSMYNGGTGKVTLL